MKTQMERILDGWLTDTADLADEMGNRPDEANADLIKRLSTAKTDPNTRAFVWTTEDADAAQIIWAADEGKAEADVRTRLLRDMAEFIPADLQGDPSQFLWERTASMIRPLMDDDDPVVSGLDVRLGVAALTGKTQQEVDLLATIARVSDPALREALMVVAKAGFATDTMDEDRNETTWAVSADGDNDTVIFIGLQQV